MVFKIFKFLETNFILWIESDIWPNMLLNVIKNRNINCLYLMQEYHQNHLRDGNILKKLQNLLLSFNKIFVQSQNDLKRIEQLSNLKAEYIGNLKLSNIHKINIYKIIKKNFQ